ncbi:MAG TPA: YcaO-like family protein [Allosphingosinicella sp.]
MGPGHGYGPVPDGFPERLRAAASRCSVTRLADITGLDRIGLPVWQAVRPAGRSLSVHQGKGATPKAARISALCEAIETACAEMVAADGPYCSFADLPDDARAPDIADYCRVRTAVPEHSEPIHWCAATNLLTGARHYLPHDLVSLDYTRALPSRFERISSGLGAGANEAQALNTSLLEIVERDAIGSWQRRDPAARAATSLRLDTIQFEWFAAWRGRFAALGVALEVFQAPSIVGVPVFLCAIAGAEEFGPAWRRYWGSAAHGDPEIALFRALAEAIQSRLTLIAGVRDDILPSSYRKDRPKPAAAPAGRVDWSGIESVPASTEAIAENLAALGYPRIVAKRLDDGLDGVFVTRVFVPGLGSLTRSRGAPR